MAAFLEKACLDPGHLHTVGDHAMDEIYLSWRDCVASAYERYQVILDEKQRGLLPKKRKMPTDYLVSLTAQSMEVQQQYRRMRMELFHDFRETAVGMMENIQEAGESLEHLWDRMAEGLHREHSANRKD